MDTAALKEKLVERKSDIFRRLQRVERDLDSDRTSDDDDRAIEQEDEEVLEAVGEAGLAELEAITAALERIDNGSYGICAKCGQPIPMARLNALPHATLCMACITEN